MIPLRPHMRSLFGSLCLLVLVSYMPPSLAERADRNQPINLEADRITVDDAKKQHILEGQVKLIQGSLVIRCQKLVVAQDQDGFQTAVATSGEGGLAHFRQKREGKDEYVDGEAERIVYDSKAAKTEFFGRAFVKSGADEVRGDYIAYDGKTENYLVSSQPGKASTSGRVSAVIQPKTRSPDEGAARPATTPPGKEAPAPGATHE